MALEYSYGSGYKDWYELFGVQVMQIYDDETQEWLCDWNCETCDDQQQIDCGVDYQ